MLLAWILLALDMFFFLSGLMKSPLRNAPDHVMSLVMTAISWRRVTVVYYSRNLQDVLYKAAKSLFLYMHYSNKQGVFLKERINASSSEVVKYEIRHTWYPALFG